MFGIPTPLHVIPQNCWYIISRTQADRSRAFVGFNIALTPLAACLMGWRGSDQQAMGVVNIGVHLYFGGMLVVIAGFLEFPLRNTFSFTLLSGYGAWFLAYGVTLQPFYQSAGAYAPPKALNQTLYETQSMEKLTEAYTASFGFEVVFMAVLNFIFFICSIRVNAIFELQILAVTTSFCLISAGLFYESIEIC